MTAHAETSILVCSAWGRLIKIKTQNSAEIIVRIEDADEILNSSFNEAYKLQRRGWQLIFHVKVLILVDAFIA